MFYRCACRLMGPNDSTIQRGSLRKVLEARRRWEAEVTGIMEKNKTYAVDRMKAEYERVYIRRDYTPVKDAFPLTDSERWDGLEPLERKPIDTQPEGNTPPHVVRATFLGPPNVGKSELVNTCATAHVSATSAKPHTTTGWIKAITRVHNTQLLLLDTPGIFVPETKRDKTRMNAMTSAWDSLQLADVAVAVVAAGEPFQNATKHFLLQMMSHARGNGNIPVVLALTKMDKVTDHSSTNRRALHYDFRNSIELMQLNGIDAVVETSAHRFSGIVELKDMLARYAKPRLWTHHLSDTTILSPPEQAAQILREVFTTYLPDNSVDNIKFDIIGWTAINRGGNQQGAKRGEFLLDVEVYFLKKTDKFLFLSKIERISEMAKKRINRQQKIVVRVVWHFFMIQAPGTKK